MPTKKETIQFIKDNDLKKDLGLSSPSSMSVQDLNNALDKFFDKSASPYKAIGNKWKKLKLKDPLSPAEVESSKKAIAKKNLKEGTLGGSSTADRKGSTMKSKNVDKFFARDLGLGREYEVSYYGTKIGTVIGMDNNEKTGLVDRALVRIKGKDDPVKLPISKFLKEIKKEPKPNKTKFAMSPQYVAFLKNQAKK